MIDILALVAILINSLYVHEINFNGKCSDVVLA